MQARWELLRTDWTSWAPLLFFGRERELATEEDKQTAADIGRYYFGQAGVNIMHLNSLPVKLGSLGLF